MPRWPKVDYSTIPKVPKVDRAWAAGVFDGEGTTCHTGRPRKSGQRPGVRMVLSQKDTGPEILLRLQAALGVGQVKERLDRPGVWVWTVSSLGDCLFALERMWPYLSTPKRTQALKTLKLTEQELSWHKPKLE